MTQERKQELVNLLRTIQSCTQTIPDYNDKESVIDCWELAFEWLNEQQPIPQDINIEAEAEKKYPDSAYAQFHFITGAQLLLPELQQLREGNGAMERQAIRDLETIEQQKSQIDELKNALNHELEVHKEFIEQAAEIESLKKEPGKLHSDLLTSVRETAYWKQRCEAAEYLLSPDAHKLQPHFDNWCKLKQQTHG